MAEWQVVLPTIGPAWNLAGLLETVGSIDVPFLLVDNSPEQTALGLTIPGLEVASHPENVGVAGSWNLGLARGADKTLILSASIRFGPGGLFKVIDYATSHCNEWGLQWGGYPMRPDGSWNVGWKMIVFTRKLIDLVGTFDENFWPGYFEDLDFSYRTFLAMGGKDRLFPLAQGDIEAVGVTKSGDAVAVKNGYGFPEGVRASGDVVKEWYENKWGGPSGEERFTHPFNDLAHDWKWWPTPPRRVYPGPGN